MPEFGLGSAVALSLLQVLPLSSDDDSMIFPLRLRISAWSLPPSWKKTVGWITPNSLPSFIASVRFHVLPRSAVRSKCTRQALSSVLDGQRSSPSPSSTGLFLIGPAIPSGKRRGLLQVFPPSSEVISIPHHSLGLGPTL